MPLFEISPSGTNEVHWAAVLSRATVVARGRDREEAARVTYQHRGIAAQRAACGTIPGNPYHRASGARVAREIHDLRFEDNGQPALLLVDGEVFDPAR